MIINPYEIYKNSQMDFSARKSFGEVFTPDELIQEMLDTLPDKVWQDPRLRWLDPAAGVGNFFALAYNRLMQGLRRAIPDEQKRRKHILEKMFYFVEIQSKSVKVIREIFNPDGTLALNIFEGDFEDFGGVTLFSQQTFDVVLGNPPYQHMHTSEQRKAKNHNLWSMFVRKGFDLVKPNGYLLYVTPPAWMSPSSKLLQDIFLKNQLHVVNVNECSRHFRGVGSMFSYYLIEKTPVYKPTRFIYDFKGGSKMLPIKGESEYLLTPDIQYIPQLPTAEAFDILRKTVFGSNQKFSVGYDSDLHRFTKKDLLSPVKDDVYRYRVVHTPGQILWSSRPHKNQNKIKVFIPLTTYFEEIMIDDCGNTQGVGYILCDDWDEAERIKHTLLSPLYRFIGNITRWSNFNVPNVMKSLPIYPTDRPLDNDEIAKYFGLSKEEAFTVNTLIRNTSYIKAADKNLSLTF